MKKRKDWPETKSQDKLKIAAALRKYRIESGLSQDYVGKYLGISRSAYTYYEIAKTMPTVFQLISLSKLYHVSLEILLQNEDFSYLNQRVKRKAGLQIVQKSAPENETSKTAVS